jgi:D-alanyl-D-alanine carboxypeptidase
VAECALSRRSALAWLGAAASGCAHLEPVPTALPEALTRSVGQGLDGLIVYVDQAGHAPQLHAAGWKDRATRTPADPAAQFKIASISKLYIAAAAAQLAASGRLPLRQTLAERLPEHAAELANAERITVEMLLQHRSGLFNFTDDETFPWFNPPRDLAGHLRWVRGRPAVFEPGSAIRYSNTNYLLLGALLDRALGGEHQRYIQHSLLGPLGLRHTFGRLELADPARMVSSYHPAHAGDLKHVPYTAPGGSMVSTAQEVGVFLRALQSGTLLNGPAQALYASVQGFAHTGLLPGYLSIARYHPEPDAVVVLLANASTSQAWAQIEAAETRVLRWLVRQPPGAGTAPSPRRIA